MSGIDAISASTMNRSGTRRAYGEVMASWAGEAPHFCVSDDIDQAVLLRYRPAIVAIVEARHRSSVEE
jgi:hypothetical protein